MSYLVIPLSPDHPQAAKPKINVFHNVFPTCVASTFHAAAALHCRVEDRLEACDHGRPQSASPWG